MNSAYHLFSYYYDKLNHDVNYASISQYIHAQLLRKGITSGIVTDLGCGTGELTLRFAKLGYDMISVDLSQEMLSITQQKASKANLSNILLLNQSFDELDLYGTMKACFSTFDSLNHVGPSDLFEATISRISLFLEQGGLFIFDVNSLYKHEEVLGNNTFYFDENEFSFKWNNFWDAQAQTTKITLTLSKKNKIEFTESFVEYFYSPFYIKQILNNNNFSLLELIDGDSFSPVTEATQRYLYVAQKHDIKE